MFRNLLNSDFLRQSDVALMMTGLTQAPQENGISTYPQEKASSAKTVLEYNERLNFKSIVENQTSRLVRHGKTQSYTHKVTSSSL